MQEHLLNEEEDDENPYNVEDQVNDETPDFGDDDNDDFSDDDFPRDSEENFDSPEEVTTGEESHSDYQTDQPVETTETPDSSQASEPSSFRVMKFEDFISQK